MPIMRPTLMVVTMIEKHDRDGERTDWLSRITADCPRKRSVDMNDQCAASLPDW
jgi:hypothetical protein